MTSTTALTDPRVGFAALDTLRLLVVPASDAPYLLDRKALVKRVEGAHQAQDDPFETGDELFVVLPSEPPLSVTLHAHYDGADDNDYLHYRLRLVPLVGADVAHLQYQIDGRS